MKIAVSGKGGVGKTTTVAFIAKLLRDAGKKVIVIDADPDMNLASVLGFPDDVKITPIVKLKELIAERTGTEVGKPAPFYKMNPDVSDIPDKYSVLHDGIKLLTMGTVLRGGAGCACPENAFLKSLLSHLMLMRDECIIVDMEAGIEHLGRGTAIGVDEMVVVVEASRMSIDTAHRVKELCGDIGIKKTRLIANMIRSPEEEQFVKDKAKGLDILGFVHYTEEIRAIHRGEISALNYEGKPVEEIKGIIKDSGWLKE